MARFNVQEFLIWKENFIWSSFSQGGRGCVQGHGGGDFVPALRGRGVVGAACWVVTQPRVLAVPLTLVFVGRSGFWLFIPAMDGRPGPRPTSSRIVLFSDVGTHHHGADLPLKMLASVEGTSSAQPTSTRPRSAAPGSSVHVPRVHEFTETIWHSFFYYKPYFRSI